MIIPAGVAGLDLIISHALQGDPASKAILNAAGGLSGMGAAAALANKIGGKSSVLANLAGYAAGGFVGDRLADSIQESTPPQVQIVEVPVEPPPPQFSDEAAMKARLNILDQQRAEEAKRATEYLEKHLAM